VTDRETNLRRAAAAVSRAIAVGPDDDEHPSYEELEALVDGRLDAAGVESVQSHVEACRICAEDVADLSGMRAILQPSPARVAAAPAWRPYMVAAASIAAILIMAVWLNQSDNEISAPAAVTATGPVPQPSREATAPVSALTADERIIVTDTIQTGRLNLPAAVSELAGSVGTLLGPSSERLPLSPIGPAGTAVLSARPVFSWHPLPGARSYTVAVFDDRFIEVARSPRLTTPAWTPATDLPTGRTLSWQITAELATGNVNGPAPPQPEARFRVIEADTAAAIVNRLSRLANEPLALGILLAQAGLFDDAGRLLEHAAADPATRQQAQPLLEQVKRR
jgi:hypothetical protein